MTTTPNLSIPLLVSNQSGKEITHNEALVIVDAILNRGVENKATNTPPGSPSAGDAYIVGSSPTGDFATHAGELAFYNNGWRFISPNEGLTIWVKDEDLLYTYDGSSWVKTGSSESIDDLSDVVITSVAQYDLLIHNGTNFINSTTVDNLTRVGINTTADSTNKLSVKSDAILFDNATDDSQIKVNKNSSTDTASHLFQTNYSGRAEFGLVGDDNFTLKVSPEGSTWNEAIIVDKSTGDVNCPEDVDVDGNLTVGATDEAGILEVKNSSEVSTVKINSTGDSFFNGGNIIFSSDDGETPSTLLEVETASDEGDAGLTVDQNDEDEPFVNFEGTSAVDQTKNISTINGDGTVEGPKNYSSSAGWAFEGMMRININGTDYWMPYYSADVS